MIIIILFWIALAVTVGIYADSKGLGGVGYFFFALFLSPLIAFIVVAGSSPAREKVAERANMKKCPDCAEYVQAEASICRFCKHHFTENLFCTACGKPLSAGADFCTVCGKQVVAAIEILPEINPSSASD